ncbi:TonB-dependent receptor [Capnocytophaga canis]|uniref:TonB-dependent receptor n=1 Tax=Capnocytophaga canis TaxID=1848903 RepID=UPI001562BAAC|nr:TonB-dependent receptor [Capnocytophaga canis]
MRNILYLLTFSCMAIGFGQEKLHLKVEDSKEKQPLVGAVIHFLGKHYVTNLEGEVAILNLKKGTFPIRVTYLGFEEYQGKVTFPTTNSLVVISMIESLNELSEVIISSSYQGVHRNTVTGVLTKNDLEKQSGESLAKMLSSVQGVSMIQSGATIAKPVIHGLHSNRVLILNNGIRQEGQQWGADHAPEIDPSMANRITVIKGADAVRYGSDALGGVILLSSSKLPYGDNLHGEVSPSFSSNGRRTTTSAKLEGTVPKVPLWAWRVQGTLKRAGDIKTADYYLNNTGVREENFSLETGWEKELWGIEAFYSQYNNESGVFYGSHIGNLEDLQTRFQVGRPLTTYPFSYEVNAPKQKVRHHLAKAKAYVFLPFGGKLTAQYAFQDNIRHEYSVRRLERSRIPALDMHLATHSLDISWENMYGKWKSQLGLTALSQENYNKPGTGITPVIPNFASVGYGAFAIQKYVEKRWEAETGVRYDYKTLNADGYGLFGQRYGGNRTFNNLTYLIGGSYKPTDFWSVTSNIGVAWRSPHVSELYSNGLHHGAGTFDIGDGSLTSERGGKWITSVKYQKEKFSAEVDLFVQLIQNYIYDAPTGKTRTLFSGVFPIFQYQQSDAFFRGADLEIGYQFLPSWKYRLKTSVVYANEIKTSRYFPFIPSERFSQEVSFELPDTGIWKNVYFSAKHQFVNKQTRFDPSQELVSSTPDAYNLFDIGFGVKLPLGNQSLDVHMSAENILNQLYKEYTNRFRYYAHDLGRNIQLRIVYSF